MYIRLQKIHKDKTKYGFDTKVTHIGLYKDDGKFVKFIKHWDDILDYIMWCPIDITLPQVQKYLTEADIDKILQGNQ